MAYIGYARVSTTGQSLDVQLEKLTHCEKIFEEKVSASSSDKRHRLKACLEYVRENDTLVITKLDRLARSTYDLCKIAMELTRKKVELHVIDQNINSSEPSGRLLFTMLGAIAQFENELRHERQMEGIARAKKKGMRLGRYKVLTNEEVVELRQKKSEGVVISKLKRIYGISKPSIYRYLDNNYFPIEETEAA